MEIFRHKLPTLLVISFFWFGCADEQSKQGTSQEEDVSFFAPSKVDLEAISGALRTKYGGSSSDSSNIGDSLISFSEFSNFYSDRNFKPLWFNKSGLNNRAHEFIAGFDSLRYDGLNLSLLGSEDMKRVEGLCQSDPISTENALQAELILTQCLFKTTRAMVLGSTPDTIKDWKIKNDSLFAISTWAKKLDSLPLSNYIQHLRPQHAWYTKFRTEYIKLSAAEDLNGHLELTPMRDSADSSIQSANLSGLRKKLFSEGGLPVDTQSTQWSADLVEGIKHFQHLRQLKQNGYLDSATYKALQQKPDSKLSVLALNMERMRRMAHDFKQPYIWVVIPKMELDYVDHDSVEFNMRVVVGRTSRPTPSLKSKIENIVFSPPWTVPPTIMKEEVVPGIARRGGSYLARRGLKAYDSRGRVVSAAAINASNYKRFSIGQAPGYRSSLGEVKFNMINPWAIYMHDTPHREDFVKSYRAYSSGCIRVHHPKQFAEFLLQDTTNYSLSKIDSICKMRKTKFVPMNRNIEVHIVYLTNAIDSAGNIMYLKDLYGWDKKSLN